MILLETFEASNIYLIGLILIIISGLAFFASLILRACRQRFLCRLLMVVSSLVFVAYTSLVFVNMPTMDWGFKDTSEVILFAISIMLLIYNLTIFFRKR